MSSSSAAGEAGLSSPSEWSEDAFLFLFFAPTRVIVLPGGGESKDVKRVNHRPRERKMVFSKELHSKTESNFPLSRPFKQKTYFGLILLLLLFPGAGITVPPATVTVPPSVFTLPFLSAPTAIFGSGPPDTGLFFLLPPLLLFFLAADTTATVPPISGEVCVLGSSS